MAIKLKIRVAQDPSYVSNYLPPVERLPRKWSPWAVRPQWYPSTEFETFVVKNGYLQGHKQRLANLHRQPRWYLVVQAKIVNTGGMKISTPNGRHYTTVRTFSDVLDAKFRRTGNDDSSQVL